MTLGSMLAEFAVRLALGLATSSLILPWRAVSLPFFRTQNQVILGLLVLAALDQARVGGHGPSLWLLVGGAVLAYVATIGWGLGLPGVGLGAEAVLALIIAGWMALSSGSPRADLSVFNACSRMASGFVMGATLTAMLLGHHYLTAPTMSIDPLQRAVSSIGGGLVVRCLLAGIGLWASRTWALDSSSTAYSADSAFFLAARWGLGFMGTALAVYLSWKTARIRSTQSATGILYIAMIFALFGELTSLIMAGRGGVIC